jgi:hypothetical protein
MADEAPLIFERVFGSLKPVNGAAIAAVNAIEGRCVVKVTKLTRNQRRRAWYWVMLDVVAEVLADSTGTPWDAETLHDDLRDTLKLVTPLKTPSGRAVNKRRSTSDKMMTEIDRARWTDRVATYLSRQIGCEISQLIDEVRNRGGGEPEWLETARPANQQAA